MTAQGEVTFEKYDTTAAHHIAAADAFKAWQDEDRLQPDYVQMFDLNPDVMREHVIGVVGFIDGSEGREPVGYNGAIARHDNGMLEIGGMIVNPRLRRQGFARKIKQATLDLIEAEFPGTRLITFTNSSSEALNRGCGFRDARPEEVPRSALAMCEKQCVNYQQVVIECGGLCCDTILVLDPGEGNVT